MGSGKSSLTWRRAAVGLFGAAAGAAILVYREAMRALDRSAPGDPWGPHRRGF